MRAVRGKKRKGKGSARNCPNDPLEGKKRQRGITLRCTEKGEARHCISTRAVSVQKGKKKEKRNQVGTSVPEGGGKEKWGRRSNV